ncbi:hypothetical protein COCVIDRAFT_14303 [Bipolaris victoriae FI3]|uniref:Uncharacterized protein n=1 Tax=Bipolaris victoriae (strain FI3) TaxID=930091 RepID=W7EYR3_BIPV3|nr:hypothetical protein COCVIDRAFT_14303 [Bipolaris victoriae FI3]
MYLLHHPFTWDTRDKPTWWECYGGDTLLGMDLQWSRSPSVTSSIGTWPVCAPPKDFGRMANGALGAIHPLGLILDQEESTDMHHTFIHDTDITMNSRQMWLALKMILDGFVRMIDQSKVLAVKEDSCDEEQ